MKAFSRSMSSRAKARRGFTLIELIVVLMILVGLAGMVIPAVTDMVARTHTSSASGNIAEVSNAIARYDAQYLSYPDGLDSLKVTLAAAAITDNAKLSTELTGNAGVAAVTVDAAIHDSLAAAGIVNLRTHADGATDDATFQATGTANLTATDTLIGLTAAGATAHGLDSTRTYVLLGVGNRSTMIGRTMTDAPVHFPENGTEGPADIYNRFLAVFDVSGERAKLVKVISPHFEGLDGHLQEYFEIVSDNN